MTDKSQEETSERDEGRRVEQKESRVKLSSPGREASTVTAPDAGAVAASDMVDMEEAESVGCASV